jgi:hypothetical protein
MKSLAVVLCVATMLVLAGTVAAQINPPEKDTPIDKTNPQEIKEITEIQKAVPDVPAPNAESVAKIKMKKMTGTVVSVDALANTMVVKSKKDSVTFAIDPNAKIMWAGNTVKLADVPKDGKIVVMYKMDGKMRIATSIADQPMMAKNTLPLKTEAPKQPTNPSN